MQEERIEKKFKMLDITMCSGCLLKEEDKWNGILDK